MLHDGSFVYASTEPILRNALRKIGLWHGGMMKLEEHDYFQISNGVIVASDQLPSMTYETYNSHARYSAATSGQGSRVVTPSTSTKSPVIPPKAVSPAKFVAGVKGSENESNVTVNSEAAHPPIGASFGQRAWTEDTDEEIDAIVSRFHAQIAERGISSGAMSDEEWEKYLADKDQPGVFDNELDMDPDDDDATFPGTELFYTLDNLGNSSGYATLDALETALLWHAGLTPNDSDFFGAKGKARWCEHFVGEIDNQGTMTSWVDNRDLIAKYDPDSNDESLEYVREGVDLLLPHRRVH
jgi:hypothetical protein